MDACFNRKWGQKKYIDSSLVLYSLCNKIQSTAIPNLFKLLKERRVLLSIYGAMCSHTPIYKEIEGKQKIKKGKQKTVNYFK